MMAQRKFDERAELLCHLVVAQLVCHASTGEWLKTRHAIESARIWSASNGTDNGWLGRAKLIEISMVLAPQMLALPIFWYRDDLVKLFTVGGKLDYRLPTVRGIRDVCAERLLEQ